jgi:hypothetical protein
VKAKPVYFSSEREADFYGYKPMIPSTQTGDNSQGVGFT